jgi:hypothetical protein
MSKQISNHPLHLKISIKYSIYRNYIDYTSVIFNVRYSEANCFSWCRRPFVLFLQLTSVKHGMELLRKTKKEFWQSELTPPSRNASGAWGGMNTGKGQKT